MYSRCKQWIYISIYVLDVYNFFSFFFFFECDKRYVQQLQAHVEYLTNTWTYKKKRKREYAYTILFGEPIGFFFLFLSLCVKGSREGRKEGGGGNGDNQGFIFNRGQIQRHDNACTRDNNSLQGDNKKILNVFFYCFSQRFSREIFFLFFTSLGQYEN